MATESDTFRALLFGHLTLLRRDLPGNNEAWNNGTEDDIRDSRIYRERSLRTISKFTVSHTLPNIHSVTPRLSPSNV